MRILTAIALIIFSGGAASAHNGHLHGHPALTWQWDWWVLLGLAVAGGLYLAGIRRMHERVGARRLVDVSRIAAFIAGMLVLFLALESPLDTLADQLFAAHMVQHMLLLFVVPPLLVWSRPPVAFLWAFRSAARRSVGGLWTGLGFNRLMQLAMRPNVVWVLFSGSFIFWHFPKPYQWALENEGVHTLEHLCFLVTGLMFWTIVIEPSGRRRLGYGGTLLHVATTAFLGSFPGALLVLAKYPLYPVQSVGAAAWGLTPLQDQQLAGVIMWVPAGLAYVLAIAWLFAKWMEHAELEEIKRSGRLARAPLLIVPLLLACGSQAHAQGRISAAGGDASHGAVLMRQFGCGACHVIRGVSGADGMVGPPLNDIASRIYVAGMLRNTPDNMVRWLMYPQQVVPGNAMPDMGITFKQARDMTAYLYTLR